LESALEREPRNFALHFLLGQIALSAGRKTEARAQLLAAKALYPRSPVIDRALRRAR
ncbi:MAG: tetratricopeptide repeat protein, partial [Gaiellaceae bacterium]